MWEVALYLTSLQQLSPYYSQFYLFPWVAVVGKLRCLSTFLQQLSPYKSQFYLFTRTAFVWRLHCIYQHYNSHLLTTSDSICSGEWLLYGGYTVFTLSATATFLQIPVPFVHEGGCCMEVALYLPSLQQPPYYILFHLFMRVAVVCLHCIYHLYSHIPTKSSSICS